MFLYKERMGEAQSGIDKPIYNLCKKHISCIFNPNIITTIGLLLIIPIIYLLDILPS